MKAVFSLALSLYVLAGTIGTPLSMHTCFAMEQTAFGFVLEDNCCSNPTDLPSPKITRTECCEFISAYLQVDFDSFSNFTFLGVAAPIQGTFETIDIPRNVTEFLHYSDGFSPPLKYGRQLLTFVQTFLI